MNIEDKVKDILRELSGETTIENSATLQEALGLDSLAMVTLLVEIEDAFGIELDEADMNPFDLTAVQNVVDLVKRSGGELCEENC